MNFEDFKIQKQAIYTEADRKLRDLLSQYARENAEFKVGDFIYNVTGVIKVDKINVEESMGRIMISYTGRTYKRKAGKLYRTKSVVSKKLSHKFKKINDPELG